MIKSNNKYHQIFEYMFVFTKGKQKTFNPIKDKKNDTKQTFGKSRRKKDGTMTHKGDKFRLKMNRYGKRFNIWRYITGKGNTSKDEETFKHPAPFPEALARDHIISWSNEDDIILDPFNGSGTTTKMAKKYGRYFIGIDISSEYCQLAIKRLQKIGHIQSIKTDLRKYC